MDGSSTAAAGPSQHSSQSPRSPPGQLSPPIALSKRTSSRNALSQTYLDAVGSPPSTPPPRDRRRPTTKTKGKGKEPANGQASRTQRLRQEHNTADNPSRHSHGLSWSSTTRDSVVDNLLLSLGNLSSQNVSGGMDGVRDDEFDFDREKYRLPDMPDFSHFTTRSPATRPRGHTYSSSLSSGYDQFTAHGMETPSSKYSNSTKGRRSNSSSNFGTISGRAGVRRLNGVGRTSSDTQRHVGGAAHAKNASSDIDSVDYGYGAILETNRPYYANRRSMSMDQIDFSAAGPNVLNRGRPVPSVHSKFESMYDDDAAPEPGVPAGPRKKLNPTATGPVYVNPAPSKNVRKVNTQSDLRSASKPNPNIPQYIQEQASDFVRNNSMRGVPSMPLPHEHSAPAPSPGFKSARKDAPSPHRERPGFFRRVFGNSRTASGTSDRSDSRDNLEYVDKVAPPTRSKSQASNDTASQTRTEPRKASKESSGTAHPPAALNKKPSSFFRRRKKSNTDIVSVPPLPVNSALNLKVKPAEPSPSVSSLRKVMDPYLGYEPPIVRHDTTDSSSRPTTQDTMDSDGIDIFHTGYTPPPEASLGHRDPLRRDAPARTKQSLDRKEDESPRMKIKKKRKPDAVSPPPTSHPSQPRHEQNLSGSSFFHDASRDTSTATINEHFKPPAELERPKVSPLTEDPPVVDVAITNDEENQRPVSRASTGDRILASKGTSPIEASEGMRSFSDGMYPGTETRDDEWVVTHTPPKASMERPGSKRSDRLFLRPTEQEEKRSDSAETLSPYEEPSRDASRKTSLTAESQSGSRSASLMSPGMFTAVSGVSSAMPSPSVYHSANSLPLPLPSLQVDGKPRVSVDTNHTRGPSVLNDEGVEYRERARKIFEGDEEDVTKMEAAAWLGERNTLSTKTLQAYMQLFDFAGQNVLTALRTLAGKLLLKGETQQFDRIITALSERWCESNPNHGFKAQDVVHTILYSLILLNTDLHMADIGEKMSKSAYVKNTLPTIRRVVADAAPGAFDDTVKPSANSSRPTLPWLDSANSAPPATSTPPETPADRTSFEAPRPNAAKRLSIRPGVFRSESDGWTPDSAGGSTASNALVTQPWSGNMRGWEFEIETVLKSFFSSIRSEPLPLLGIQHDIPSDRNLSVANLGGLKRSGSVVSKAPSDNMSYRSKPGFRTMTMGWQNRNNRSRPKLYPASTVTSSRTSFDDGNSMWSPAQSSTWSKNSFAKTLTSASMNSLGYHLSPTAADYKHSIGFANALSQAIIREEGTSGDGDSASVTIPGGLLEDEALALEGAPWAKEGLVKHKHHLETPDRKAKERSWVDCFAVISKGKLTLFAFGTSSKSHSMGRNRHQKQGGTGGRAASLAATKVGGGDWMENAEQLDTFILRQTIASTLPPPGYSKARAHVWALSLPNGAVHLFQVGTPEIAQEFMTSANYWSARLSKEPLSGSVSNVEYGWSDQVINTALIDRSEGLANSPPPSMANVTSPRHMHSSSGSGGNMSRPSFQSSLRGSFDTGFGASARNRLPGDKAQIADWQPPTQSMMASQLLEIDQLRGLTAYVSNVETELGRHNELKHAIELAYSPRHANYNRAMMNWQRKSDYLLREIVKFRTYIDSLTAAQKAKERYDSKKAADHEAKSLEVKSLQSTSASAQQDGSSSKGGVSPVDSGRMKEERDLMVKPPQTAHSVRSTSGGGGSGRFREELG